MTADELSNLFIANMPGSQVSIETDDEVHFSAVIISDQFLGLKSIARQKLVYSFLNNLITDGTIHAITLKTFTTEEWANNA